jgi:hypothetical protein
MIDSTTLPAPDTSALPPADRPRRFRLRRTPHRIALTAHVLASVGWFGCAVLVAVLVAVAGSTGDPSVARALYRAVGTAIWVTVPFGLAAVVTGVVLGLGTTWGLARHWWVVAKEFMAVAVIATDLVLLGPNAQDAFHGHLSGPLLDPAIAHCIVLTAATVLSVFKPRGRTARGRRGVPSRA